MKKTKLLAVSGICSVFALLCLLAASYLSWFAVIAGAGASIAVCIPLLIGKNNGVFSLLAYLSSSILGAILGVANIGYVVIIATFAMPFSMWKCFVEGKLAGKTLLNNTTSPNTNKHQTTTDHSPEQFKNFTDDPFSQNNQTPQPQQSTVQNSANNQQFQNNQPPHCIESFEQGKNNCTSRLSRATLTVVKWIGYFVICEVGLFLTALFVYLFTPSVFQHLVETGYIYIAIVVGNLAVFPLNYLLNPAFALTGNILKKARLLD